MARLTGWWHRRSDPARIELYVRSSFHLFAVIEVVALVVPTAGALGSAWARITLSALVTVHAVLCAVLSSRGIDWILARRERPVGLLAAVAVVSVTGASAAALLHTAGSLRQGGQAAVIAVGLLGFGLGATALAVRGIRALLSWLLGAVVGAAAVGALLGQPWTAAVALAVAVLVTGGCMVFTSLCSVWLVCVVWELDAAREAQTQLAVAEERLRFGRDLHDVMGRNLAVIALKSELAVQLARRGSPEAVEQMVEVQRIARESQREVRAVVRGYRGADLAVELAGALSVLRAAGIDGRAQGVGGGELPVQVQVALGWVVREATTNVLRHSEARSCTIRLTAGEAAVLSVDNDGVPEARADGVSADGVGADGSGSGLRGLAERLAVLGGSLDTESGSGVFRLTARVPLPGPPSRTGTLAPAADRRGAAV
ncbi:two-component system sensor histidine kinase DesK [Streptomyces sp. 846.5]|nr:histidine kinase [Streptomyces sp. 846.5]TDT98766.1 two-component system sensor histidine kinase DesK [Streptomyces sp. 846.5]